MSEKKKPIEQRLSELLRELGWDMGIPKMSNDEDIIPGMIIGESEYVSKILSYVPDDAFSKEKKDTCEGCTDCKCGDKDA